MIGIQLIAIAKAAIANTLQGKQTVDTQKIIHDFPFVLDKGASFITLTLHGQLRGCIGSIVAHRPLLEDLILNAQSAAFDDPRFVPLSKEEFEEVKIEVSLLTQPKLFDYDNVEQLRQKVTPNDGVIIKKGALQATFLPQVWEELPDFDSFFSHLCQKAGMQADCLALMPEIYLYQVEKFKE